MPNHPIRLMPLFLYNYSIKGCCFPRKSKIPVPSFPLSVNSTVSGQQVSSNIEPLRLFYTLQDPSKSEGAPFYCELCAAKMENLEASQNHVRSKAHKKLKKVGTDHLTSKHLKDGFKKNLAAPYFNPLLGVWKSDETHFLVFDVIYQT